MRLPILNCDTFRMKVLVSRKDLLAELAEKLDKRRFDGSRIIVSFVQCNLFMSKRVPDQPRNVARRVCGMAGPCSV